MHTKGWLVSMKGRDHSDDLGLDGRIILKLILGKQGWRVWAGFISLSFGTVSGFHKRRELS
jgi:hypothetical protein